MSAASSSTGATAGIANNLAKRRNIVIIGGGIQGSAVAYYLATGAAARHDTESSSSTNNEEPLQITILESEELASAASGKGGGFMARSWGDGSSTQRLHELSFDLYESLAETLPIPSYRKLPVLSVQPGSSKVVNLQKRMNAAVAQVVPNWLNGSTGPISMMGSGVDTAQVTPLEVTRTLVETSGAKICYGTAIGIVTVPGAKTYNSMDPQQQQVSGVIYTPRENTSSKFDDSVQQTLECDTVVICAGPWSCIAEDWFPGVDLPMQGIKSTSIVWKAPETQSKTTTASSTSVSSSNTNNNKDELAAKVEETPVVVDATALFCGEDKQFGTHLEVYPRPDNTIYICGIGGSDYIDAEQLKAGAFRNECLANPSRVEAAVGAFTKMSSSDLLLDRVQACMRPCPPDALPYMGSIPGYNGAYMNAGHNCWGIAWAPGCGKAMSELILDGTCTSVDLTPFDPARFSLKPSSIGSTRGRKKGTLNVGEQW